MDIKTAPKTSVVFAVFANEVYWYKAWWFDRANEWVVSDSQGHHRYSDSEFQKQFISWSPVGGFKEDPSRYIEIGCASIKMEDGYEHVTEGTEQEGDKYLHWHRLKWRFVVAPYRFPVAAYSAVIRPIKMVELPTDKHIVGKWYKVRVGKDWVCAQYTLFNKKVPFDIGGKFCMPDEVIDQEIYLP